MKRWVVLLFAILSTASATICVNTEESWGPLMLTNFKIHADTVYVGDTVRYTFKIENTGDDEITLGKKGVYLKVNGKYLTHHSGEVIKPGDYLTVDSTFKVDSAGEWKVNPGVCVKTLEGEMCHDFQVCYFDVLIKCPEGSKCLTEEEGSGYVKISDYVCGYKISQTTTALKKIPMYCYVEEGCPEQCQCLSKEEAEKNGFTPCGGCELKLCGYDGEEMYCYQRGVPDLRISDVWPYESSPGVYSEIRALIYNAGEGYASNTTVAFFVDGEFVGEVDVKDLNPNENVVVSLNYPEMCSGNQDVFEAEVDYHNFIAESDETNNRIKSRVYECPGVGIPDLEVVDVWHKGEENYTYTVREYSSENGIMFKVRNIGNATSPSTEIRLYIDGSWHSTTSIPSLDPGEEYEGGFSYIGTCSGNNDSIRVVVDPLNQITEANEDNNELTEIWDCYVTTEEKSDLIIRKVWLEPFPDYKYKIGYEIKNQGTGYAPGSHTGLYIDGNLVAQDYVDRLAPGESVEKVFWWNYSMTSCTPPADIMRVIADYENGIEESEEGNNDYTLTWNCTEIPQTIEKPDLVILQAWYDFPVGTDDVTIRYRIKNQGNTPSPSSVTKIYINYHEFDTDGVPPLNPGETVDRSFSRVWHPRTTTYFTANYSIEIVADANNDVNEMPYETNNIWRTYWEFALTCNDGIKNRDEEGVDCGGTFCIPCDPCNATKLPKRFDWRDYYELPPVRSQRGCGSCWAFSAVGAIEGTYIVENHRNLSVDLSEQNLVSDCGCPGSCLGGSAYRALNYIKDSGIVEESCFPYQSIRCVYRDSNDNLKCYDWCKCDGKCASPCSCNKCSATNLWRVNTVGVVSSDIDEIKRALVCHGPLSACSGNWWHCIVIVGYDDELNGGSWIIRNSWGAGWRNNGYGSIPYTGHNFSDLKEHVYYVGGVSSP